MNNKVHWSFWLIGIFALLWNGLGSLNFILQMNAEMVASFPDTHKAIINTRPIWATGGFGLAVFGGTLGAILLLLRKATAIYLFIASLAGAAITIIHTITVANSSANFSTSEIVVMIALPVIVGAFFVWYTWQAKNKNWVS